MMENSKKIRKLSEYSAKNRKIRKYLVRNGKIVLTNIIPGGKV